MKSSGLNNGRAQNRSSRDDKMKFNFNFNFNFIILYNIAHDHTARKSSYPNHIIICVSLLYSPSILVATTKVRVPHQSSQHHLYLYSTSHTSNPASGSPDSAPSYPKLPDPPTSKEAKKKKVSRDKPLSCSA